MRGGREPDVLPPGLPELPRAADLRPIPSAAAPDDRIAHNGIFAALGRATYRHRRWLPIAGLALVIGLNVWAATAGDRLSQGGWQVDGSEAARAEALRRRSVRRAGHEPDRDLHRPRWRRRLRRVPGDRGRHGGAARRRADRQRDPDLRRRRRPVVPEPRRRRRRSRSSASTRRWRRRSTTPSTSPRWSTRRQGSRSTVTGIPLVQHEFNEAIEEDLLRGRADQPADRDAHPARRVRHARRRRRCRSSSPCWRCRARWPSSACWPASPR